MVEGVILLRAGASYYCGRAQEASAGDPPLWVNPESRTEVVGALRVSLLRRREESRRRRQASPAVVDPESRVDAVRTIRVSLLRVGPGGVDRRPLLWSIYIHASTSLGR